MAAQGDIGAVVLAAGAGRRMGNLPKALLRRNGEPLLLRQIRLAAEAGTAVTVVVLGHHAETLTRVLQRARAEPVPVAGMDRVSWVVNPDPDRGTASSLRCGLRALPASVSEWLVLLGDQPLLEASDVRAVLQAWATRAEGIELVVPAHAGQPGHPVVFGPALRETVLRAGVGDGVREWRLANKDRVAALQVTHARCTTDIDTPADLERLQSGYDVRLDLADGRASPPAAG